MERVAFLLETGERLGCLLNPESVVMRRVAGVRPRRSARGALVGAGLTDDPLLYTGGGLTELQLDLLFDVTVAGSSITTDDVRTLTGPLWRLSENPTGALAARRLPQVTFIWGRAWNVPGVIAAVAEKLEYFTTGGAPRRSWVRMRMLRVPPPEAPATPTAQPLLIAEGANVPGLPGLATPGEPEPQAVDYPTHQVLGGADDRGEGVGERLDEIANQYYGDPSLWRLLAAFNAILDPMHLAPGTVIQIPPKSVLTG
jgi:hypothetical protein